MADRTGSRDDWTPAFEGQRPPRRAGDPAAFKPGNTLAVRHGAYSTALADSPRVLELCDEIRAVAPWLQPADEVGVRLLAFAVARLEQASKVTLEPPPETGDSEGWATEIKAAKTAAGSLTSQKRSRSSRLEEWSTRVKASSTLSRDERGWLNQALKLAHELGLTPAGRAAIEERERTVILVADVQELLEAYRQAAAQFIPRKSRSAFLVALDEAWSPVMPERPGLPSGGDEG